MSRRYDVEVSEIAREKLIRHAVFLAEVDMEDALRLTDRFETTANSLMENPERGSWVNEDFLPKYTYRKLHIYKWYWIYYVVLDDMVYIETIRDTRQEDAQF